MAGQKKARVAYVSREGGGMRKDNGRKMGSIDSAFLAQVKAQEQSQQAQQARGKALVVGTAQLIYAQLVVAKIAGEQNFAQSPDDLRTLAKIASKSAPYLGEALGLFQIKDQKGSDEVNRL